VLKRTGVPATDLCDETAALRPRRLADDPLLLLPGLERVQLVHTLLLHIPLPLLARGALRLRTTGDKGLREGALLHIDGTIQIAKLGNVRDHALAECPQLGDLIAIDGQRDQGGHGAEQSEEPFVRLQPVVGDVNVVQRRALLEVGDGVHGGQEVVRDVQGLQVRAAGEVLDRRESVVGQVEDGQVLQRLQALDPADQVLR
jgi:hypothetical protein